MNALYEIIILELFQPLKFIILLQDYNFELF